MNAPIISAQVAEDFNRIVQTQIDPRLFLFCNYQPTVRYTISEDGRFYDAIQDLYKFTVDTCFVLKNYRDYLPAGTRFNTFHPLRDAIRLIEMLRSVRDHNQSEDNGWLDQEYLNHYRRWLMEILGKSEPTVAADFRLLNRALESVASTVINQTDLLLHTISSHSDRDLIAAKWYDKALYWLTHNTHTQLYTGQLISAYIAKAERNKKGRLGESFYTSWNLNNLVKNWIEHSLFYQAQQALDTVKEKLEREQNALEHPSSTALKFLAQMSATDREAYENEKRSKITKYQERKEKLEQDLAQLHASCGDSRKKRVDYFYAHLEDHLRQTAAFLESQGLSYTLLPSDLLQQDVDLRFGQIPSPDGDF